MIWLQTQGLRIPTKVRRKSWYSNHRPPAETGALITAPLAHHIRADIASWLQCEWIHGLAQKTIHSSALHAHFHWSKIWKALLRDPALTCIIIKRWSACNAFTTPSLSVCRHRYPNSSNSNRPHQQVCLILHIYFFLLVGSPSTLLAYNAAQKFRG